MVCGRLSVSRTDRRIQKERMGAMRLTFDEIKSEIKRVLVKYGMPEEKADDLRPYSHGDCLRRVYSHGTNRVARFVNYIQKDGWTLMLSLPWNVNSAPSGFIMETWVPAS